MTTMAVAGECTCPRPMSNSVLESGQSIHSYACCTLLCAQVRLRISASSELLVRLRAYPKMWEALKALPPKVLALSSSEPSKPVELPAEESLETRVDDVTARIQQATFTGKGGDKEKVIVVYKDYVARIATALQKTLALAAVENAPKEEVLMPMPSVMVPPAAPLRFAAGQVLLSLHDAEGRRSGGEGGTTRIAFVDDTGHRVEFPLSSGHAEVAYDAVSQAVLPWRSLALGGTQPRLSKH